MFAVLLTGSAVKVFNALVLIYCLLSIFQQSLNKHFTKKMLVLKVTL